MPLKPCRECKKKVSTEAATCPSCGVPNPTSNTKRKSAPEPTSVSNKNFSSFIKSFWNGEWSLVQSFWGYGVVGSIIVGIPLIYAQFNVNQMSESTATFFLIYFGFFVAFFVWVNVGIWNSATNYSKKNKTIWGTAAKVIVVLSVINTISRSFIGY